MSILTYNSDVNIYPYIQATCYNDDDGNNNDNYNDIGTHAANDYDDNGTLATDNNKDDTRQ